MTLDMQIRHKLYNLALYKDEKHHMFQIGREVTSLVVKELFNHLHSSLCNVVEHTFNVWKIKWRILLKMSSYPMIKQKMIVAATMCPVTL
jgi:hypothetical protein